MTDTDAYGEHITHCPICWLQREEQFACNEYSRWPEALQAGYEQMMGPEAREAALRAFDEQWWDHGVSPDIAERFADTAEFIAAWLKSGAEPPVRPRVIEYLRGHPSTYTALPWYLRNDES